MPSACCPLSSAGFQNDIFVLFVDIYYTNVRKEHDFEEN